MNKTLRKVVRIILGSAVIICIVGGVYVSNYYHTDSHDKEAVTASNKVEIIKEKNYVVLKPENATKGIIFYPGAKVEYTAYTPLFRQLADKGVLCVVLHSPGNIAFLDMDEAEGFNKQYSEIKEWYVAGHSMGGVVASKYAYDHSDDLKGLILLASYPTKDLTQTKLKCLSIIGSEDKVVRIEKYNKAKSLLPNKTTLKVLEGGNHAQFGCYGKQKKDGIATIDEQTQQTQTANLIYSFLK